MSARLPHIVNINTRQTRIALQHFVKDILDIDAPLSAIKIKENSVFLLNDEPILRTDRHFHFDGPRYTTIATFRFLNTVSEYMQYASYELKKKFRPVFEKKPRSK